MSGIGLECGMASDPPRCKRRNSTPASTLAAVENGGVLISPCSHASGLSRFARAGIICPI
jgi:hypothetical protein